MKLTQKLTLAFVLVSLIVVGLAAAFVWTTTSALFDRYLLDQRQAEFIAVATAYYQAHGNWQGVDTALREQGLLPPMPQPGMQPAEPQPFALVGPNGLVIIPGRGYQRDQLIPAEELARGVPIEVDGQVVGTVMRTGQEAARSILEEEYLAGINRSLLVAAVGGAGIALALGLFLARSLTRPLRGLTRATHDLARGKLEQQVPVGSADEIGELATAFNQMSADLARLNQSRRQMTADIAHDLRNPLTVIGGYLESLQDGKLKPTPECFETMQSEVAHMKHLVEDLRTLSLADSGELAIRRQPVAPAELLDRALAAYRHQAEGRKIDLTAEAEAGLPELSLDPERMEQVLGNLISNAMRYTPEGGSVRMGARQAGGRVVLSVQDTGSGIAPDVVPHIFDRSYRGDPSRSGSESGLGLAIARAIVELHGGRVEAASEGEGKGSIFSISLPRDR